MKIKHSNLLLLAAATIVVNSSAYAATAVKSNVAGTTELTSTAPSPSNAWTGGAGTNGSPASGDIVSWNNTSLVGNQTISSAVTWDKMTFSGLTGALSIGGTGTITLNATGGNSNALDNNGAGQAVTISNNIILGYGKGSATTLGETGNRVQLGISTANTNLILTGNVTSNGTAFVSDANVWLRGLSTGNRIDGTLTVDGQLGKADVGTWTLNGINTIGRVFVNNGTLLAGSDQAFGAGTIYLSDNGQAQNPVIASKDSTARTYANSLDLTVGTISNTLAFTGSTTASFGQTSGGTGTQTFSTDVNLGTSVRRITTHSATTFAGAIIGAGGGINKLGASTLTLSGNSYSGTTTVSAGTLNLTGSLASAITVNSGASISGNGDGTTTGVTTDLLTMNGGSFIKLAGGATTTSLTANGVNFAGATNLLFSTPLVNGNTYDVVSYGAGPLTDLSNLNGSAYRGGFTDTGTKITMTANFGTRTWNAIANTGYWEIDTDPNFDEGDQKFFNGDSVIFGDIASDATITLIGRLAPASVVVSNNNASTYTFSGTTGTHDITGNSSLTKSGAGTLTINSAHTYSGGTTIDGGTIKLETGATPGTGAITINNTGKLSINDQGVLNSAAAVTVNAGGTFEILGTAAGQDFSGTVILNGGKLLNNDWAFSYKPIVLNAGDQTVEVIGNTFHLFGGNGKFTGTGNLIKEGAGTLATWSSAGTSDFTGTTTVNAGTLSLVAGAGGFSATSAVTIAAGATVDIKTNERLNDAASVTANGNFKLSGAVTETIASLNGASTGQVFNGTTSTAATLVVGANNATGSFAGTIVNGTGAMALTKIGTGTQTLSGTNTYTGTTTVTAGTLSLATASLADTSTVSISTGATLDLPHGTTDNIVALVINGTPKADGLYKAVGAAGLGTELAELTGTGKLLVTPANTFATWMGGFSFAAFPGANLTANGDTDGDGIKNLLEQVFGTAPNAATTGLTQVGGTASSLTFKHPLNASLASDVTYSYQWSSNLAEWRSSGQANTGGTTATIVAGAPVAGEVTVTTTISAGPAIKVFVRVVANQAP